MRCTIRGNTRVVITDKRGEVEAYLEHVDTIYSWPDLTPHNKLYVMVYGTITDVGLRASVAPVAVTLPDEPLAPALVGRVFSVVGPRTLQLGGRTTWSGVLSLCACSWLPYEDLPLADLHWMAEHLRLASCRGHHEITREVPL